MFVNMNLRIFRRKRVFLKKNTHDPGAGRTLICKTSKKFFARRCLHTDTRGRVSEIAKGNS